MADYLPFHDFPRLLSLEREFWPSNAFFSVCVCSSGFGGFVALTRSWGHVAVLL